MVFVETCRKFIRELDFGNVNSDGMVNVLVVKEIWTQPI